MTPDTKTLDSPSWLQFVAFEGVGIFLVDKQLTTKVHQSHSSSRGRYTVVQFATDGAEVIPCDECGLPQGMLVTLQPMNVICSVDDLAEAERSFAAAEATLRWAMQP